MGYLWMHIFKVEMTHIWVWLCSLSPSLRTTCAQLCTQSDICCAGVSGDGRLSRRHLVGISPSVALELVATSPLTDLKGQDL